MKNLLPLLLILVTISKSFILFGQSRFNISIPNTSNQFGYTLVEDDSSYKCVVLEGNFTYNYTFQEVKLDLSGNIIDTNYFGIQEAYNGFPLYLNNNYAVTGGKDSLPGIGSMKPYMVMFNSNLDSLWAIHETHFYHHSQFLSITYLEPHYYASGRYYTPNGDYSLFITKIDTLGQVHWTKTYYPYGYNKLGSKILSSNNHLYVSGSVEFNNDRNLYIGKFDTAGIPIYQKNFGTTEDDFGQFYTATDTSFLLLSWRNNGLGGSSGIYEIDTNGNVNWSKQFWLNTNGSEECIDLKRLPNGDIVIAASVEHPVISNNLIEGVLVKFDPNGNQIWKRRYVKTYNNNYFREMIPTSDGGFLMTGFHHGPHEAWVVKVDSMGCETPLCYLGEEELGSSLPIFKSYPNPANDFCYLEGKKEFRLVQIFDLKGKLIEELKFEAGTLSAKLNISNYESGILILKVFGKENIIVGQAKIVKN